MPEITPSPFVITDALLTLGTNDYQASVTSASLTPSASNVSIQGMAPTASFTASTLATWALALTVIQSLEADALLVWLFNHEGEEVSFKLEPVKGGTGWSGTVIVTPAAIGGAVNAYGTSTVTLGCKGKPSLVAA